MARWLEFEQSDPELAALARERFAATDLVMLGTLRANGWPRITPIEYTFFEGDLVLGGMWQSRKFLDLQRDPRCAIHSTTANKDGQEGDVKLYGRAHPLPADRIEPYWKHIFDQTGWRADGPAHVSTMDIESAAYVRFSAEGTMRWKTWPGGQWREKKA